MTQPAVGPDLGDIAETVSLLPDLDADDARRYTTRETQSRKLTSKYLAGRVRRQRGGFEALFSRGLNFKSGLGANAA